MDLIENLEKASARVSISKQDYPGLKLLSGGHDSHGEAICETIQAPWDKDWQSETGATSPAEKHECFSQ